MEPLERFPLTLNLFGKEEFKVSIYFLAAEVPNLYSHALKEGNL